MGSHSSRWRLCLQHGAEHLKFFEVVVQARVREALVGSKKLLYLENSSSVHIQQLCPEQPPVHTQHVRS